MIQLERRKKLEKAVYLQDRQERLGEDLPDALDGDPAADGGGLPARDCPAYGEHRRALRLQHRRPSQPQLQKRLRYAAARVSGWPLNQHKGLQDQ